MVGYEKLEDGKPVPVEDPVDGVEDNPLLSENVNEGPPGVKGFNVVLVDGGRVEEAPEGKLIGPVLIALVMAVPKDEVELAEDGGGKAEVPVDVVTGVVIAIEVLVTVDEETEVPYDELLVVTGVPTDDVALTEEGGNTLDVPKPDDGPV